ncbi:MAG: hypothetical protein DIZ80_16895 [endosymbiont of Galathealinum brachiosum]|uniref:Uncharacterized protein n=1 Tax=endosymbiont of Galathealinum brachiosum TaxID=2200906 RepID=A0A370D8K2_9GAMM|nr:MAG: hypothetical protein DIZ80_16895 [endosymbiont of Galathealinum brachiosum]
MTNKIFKPRGDISRYIDTAITFIISIASLFIYYSINHVLCIDAVCKKLTITSYWVSSSGLYILYAISSFISGIYLFKTGELARIYAMSIIIVICSSFILCAMMFFAIAREISTFT